MGYNRSGTVRKARLKRRRREIRRQMERLASSGSSVRAQPEPTAEAVKEVRRLRKAAKLLT